MKLTILTIFVLFLGKIESFSFQLRVINFYYLINFAVCDGQTSDADELVDLIQKNAQEIESKLNDQCELGEQSEIIELFVKMVQKPNFKDLTLDYVEYLQILQQKMESYKKLVNEKC